MCSQRPCFRRSRSPEDKQGETFTCCNVEREVLSNPCETNFERVLKASMSMTLGHSLSMQATLLFIVCWLGTTTVIPSEKLCIHSDVCSFVTSSGCYGTIIAYSASHLPRFGSTNCVTASCDSCRSELTTSPASSPSTSDTSVRSTPSTRTTRMVVLASLSDCKVKRSTTDLIESLEAAAASCSLSSCRDASRRSRRGLTSVKR